MKIAIITQGITRIVNPLLASGHQVVGIIEAARQPGCRPAWRHKLLTAALALPKRLQGQPGSLRQLAKLANIPYYYMQAGSSPALESWLRALAPEVIVVYSMSELLGTNIFQLPPRGTINLHPAFLPAYRGPDPCFWAYYNQEEMPGATVHLIDQNEDTGPILKQATYHLPRGTRLPAMLDLAVGQVGVRLLLETLAAMEANHLPPPSPQPYFSPTPRARNVSLEEYATLIPWQEWDIKRLWHFLRGTELWLDALSPAPDWSWGFCWQVNDYERENLTTPTTNKPLNKTGTIYKEAGKYYLACRDGRIELQQRFSWPRLLSIWL